MQLVQRKNYKVITREKLNEKVPSLVIFGDDNAPLKNIISDVFNMFQIFEKHLDKGDLSGFNVFDYITPIAEAEKQEGYNKDAYFMNTTFLSIIRYAKAFGTNPYEKTANLMFNIKLLTSPILDTFDFRDFVMQFRGYATEDEIKESIGMLFDTRNSGIDDYGFLSSNIRSNVCDLSPQHLQVLSDKPMKEVAINSITFPFLKVVSNYKQQLDRVSSDSGNSIKQIKDRDSDSVVQVRVSSASQLKGLSGRQLADPRLIEKYVKGELVTRERVGYVKNKQVLVFAMDNSGSMNGTYKQTHVKSIMLDVLSRVISGDAEVHFHAYEADITTSMVARTDEEARNIFKWVQHNRPPGGGTNIAAVLQRLIDQAIATGLNKPSVTIILDGDDVLDPDKVDTKGVIINAILLGQKNEGISRITSRTGGFCILEDLYAHSLK